MLLSNALNKTDKRLTYAKMLDGSTPIFTRFGQNVYASDVVQMCIDRIATETAKLQPKHIRIKADDSQEIPKNSLNRLFKFGPNELMTTSDFLEKVTWLLYLNYNTFIYPKWEISIESGKATRDCKGLYPLNPIQATFLQDPAQRLFVEFTFANGQKSILPYSDVIHLRKRFSQNDIMGGGVNGQPDNQALLKVLEINDTVLQGLGKAVKTSLSVRGIIKLNTMVDDEEQRKERARFERLIDSGETGIMPVDIKGEYIDLKPDPKLLDKETLEFLQNKILYHYGVSIPILSGKFTDEDYQAFYESTLERQVIGLGQAFTKCLFTENELNHGNEIVFYHRDMMYLSTKTKLELLKTAGEQGLLTDDQKLRILGYPPLSNGEGNRRTISLNFVSTDIADEYQLTKAKSGKLTE